MADSTPGTRIKAAWSGPAYLEATTAVGDMSDGERDLWRRLADEVERWLSRDPDAARATDPAVDDPLFK